METVITSFKVTESFESGVACKEQGIWPAVELVSFFISACLLYNVALSASSLQESCGLKQDKFYFPIL